MSAFDLIHGTPPALPGSCFKCASATRKRYLDFKFDIEFHGAIYLCDECVTELATMLGMTTEQKTTELNFKVLALEETRHRLDSHIKTLEGIIREYDDVRDYLASDGSSVADPESFSDLASSDSEQELSEGEGDISDGEGGTPESSNVEDLDGLRTSLSGQESVF